MPCDFRADGAGRSKAGEPTIIKTRQSARKIFDQKEGNVMKAESADDQNESTEMPWPSVLRIASVTSSSRAWRSRNWR